MPEALKKPVLSSPVLGVVLFILAEVMMFAAFISAFVIVKSSYTNWPPMGQPRLPVWETAFNSLFLFLSAVTIRGARVAPSSGKAAGASPSTPSGLVLLTLILGLAFVGLQGREWIRLIGYGLTLTSSVYGSFFYVIIGFHALHVLGAITALAFMYGRLRRGRLTAEAFAGVKVFWYFVVALWPILYSLVYL
ncbi:MAG: cytochrome c oxidase subunit 3 [Deltaproteobacteria bacterium]|nr:cytochrome c oxidase subunit 3 [Deltaproteobacteria bacterium]